MRVLLALAVVLALAGCGGDSEDAADDGGGAATTVGEATVGSCLGDRGYGLLPTASGVSATTPSGVEFTIAFFPTPDGAKSAAAKAGGGATAVENAVIKPTGKQLKRRDLEAIEECVRGGDDD